MTHVLVTGSTGFVGSHLVKHLVRSGFQVRCLVRRNSDRSRISPEHVESKHVEFAEGDVSDRDSMRRALDGVDFVYHLAGATKSLNSSELFRVNADGTQGLLETCAGLTSPPTVVQVSSLAAAGPSTADRPRTESDRAQPVSDYGRSKLAGEIAARRFSDRVPLSIVRPPIVMGEYDRDGLEMFKGIANWGVHCVSGFEDHRFSVIHAADLAMALQRVALRGSRVDKDSDDGRGIYFVDGSEKPTYAGLGQMIGQALGRDSVHVVRVPKSVLWTVAIGTELVAQITRRPQILSRDKVKEATAGSWTCCSEKINADVEFSPGKKLQQRLNQTARWYRQHGWIRKARTTHALPQANATTPPKLS